MKYSELEIKAMLHELALSEDVLVALAGMEPSEAAKSTKLSELDTDRAQAELENAKTVEAMDFQNRPAGSLGTEYGMLQEDQRVRRDVNISRQGHKRLMLSCLETLYRRTLKLRKETGVDNQQGTDGGSADVA